MNESIKVSLDTPQKMRDFLENVFKKIPPTKAETLNQRLFKAFREKQPDDLVLESLEAEVDLLKNTFGWSEHEILSLPCIERASLVKEIIKLKEEFGWDGSRESLLAICRNRRDELSTNN